MLSCLQHDWFPTDIYTGNEILTVIKENIKEISQYSVYILKKGHVGEILLHMCSLKGVYLKLGRINTLTMKIIISMKKLIKMFKDHLKNPSRVRLGSRGSRGLGFFDAKPFVFSPGLEWERTQLLCRREYLKRSSAKTAFKMLLG